MMTHELPAQIAQYIDHTLLRKDATEGEITQLCAEAREFGFKAVCVEPKWVAQAVSELRGSDVLVATVNSFPGGNDSTEQKCAEARESVLAGAQEIDTVLNRDLLKAGKIDLCFQDLKAVVSSAGSVPVKVILETSELNRDEIILACGLAKRAGAAFVKTSTGFSKAGATAENVSLMRFVVGAELGVKASGGVRSFEDAQKMISAGATRLGTSASVAIVSRQTAKADY